jgi:hypothetical protein
MTKTFIPFPGRIVFEPMSAESIYSSTDDMIEAGTVVKTEGTEFVKEGDTICFLRWGAEETPEVEGKKYWTIIEDKRFIMGVLRNENAI